MTSRGARPSAGRVNPGLTALKRRVRASPRLIAAIRLVRSLATPMGRSLLRLERTSGDTLLQPSTLTRPDRHPPLFLAVQQRLAGRAAPKVLVFGCSTGEEAFTLARYLPRATIDAIDINPRCIGLARRAAQKKKMHAIAFHCASSPDHLTGAYDATFALSVLRHGRLEAEAPADCKDILPFARFEQTIEALDRRVKPGGLLVLWGCNFRFADTRLAIRYRLVPIPGKKPQPGPFYGPDNQLLAEESYAEFLFEKR